jgi:hypothetical protein
MLSNMPAEMVIWPVRINNSEKPEKRELNDRWTLLTGNKATGPVGRKRCHATVFSICNRTNRYSNTGTTTDTPLHGQPTEPIDRYNSIHHNAV